MKELTFCAVALATAAGMIGCSSHEPGAPEQTQSGDDAELTISIGGGDDDDDLDSITIDPARELLITHLSVVEDPVRTTWPAGAPVGPQAAWTFGRLMEKMAGGQDAAQFCLEWLQRWGQDQVVNGYTAPARPAVQTLVIDPWLQASGGQTLNLRIAPFRLLAIVNRIDLRSKSPTGEISPGEGRFVFGFVKPDGSPSPFTVILEYRLPGDNENDVIEWANEWHDLGETPFGAKFNTTLQKLTDKFSGPNCPGKPNNSCLNQLRTNEVPLDPNKVWEMREYRLAGSPVKITPAPMVLTPDASYNGSNYLATYINTTADLIKQRKHTMNPAMLGASSFSSLTTFWDAPGILDSEARHKFALSTCNGCHTAETGTTFLHVKNRAAGVESKLSGYMTGITVNDPISGVSRTFSELASRAQDMTFVLETDDDDLFPAADDDNEDN
jgi:hypothetical protein